MLANRLEVVHIGTAYAATMSMIATTIINSSNENPRVFWRAGMAQVFLRTVG
jgi:hypothetical protein